MRRVDIKAILADPAKKAELLRGMTEFLIAIKDNEPHTIPEANMIECSYGWCLHHQKDEPFCKLDSCIQPKNVLEIYNTLRKSELIANNPPKDSE